MYNQELTFEDQLKQSPFREPMFSAELKRKILRKARHRERLKVRPFRVYLAFALGLILVFGLSFVNYVGKADPWAIRAQYVSNNKELFRIFPEPTLSAGKQAGYIIRFTEPFQTFDGKLLAIYAYHQKTGMRVTALAPQTIKVPSPGYPGLERFALQFGLPLSGKWRYEVQLDGVPYGDAVLSVADGLWDVSPAFVSGPNKLHGIENKVAFIDAGFIAGKMNKYLWYFWGTDLELSGPFRVAAVKQGSTDMIDVFAANSLGGGNDGADRTLPSSMSLPEPGRWRLLVYIADRLFDSIVVEVR